MVVPDVFQLEWLNWGFYIGLTVCELRAIFFANQSMLTTLEVDFMMNPFFRNNSLAIDVNLIFCLQKGYRLKKRN